MGTTPILGPVAFSGFEVPERITVGGKQRLVVHTLPGGGRIVDAMGPDDAPIRWSGVFSGPNASERVRTLERLRRAGDVLLLSWDGWRYSVIIQVFEAEVTSAWWIPYRIELCVLPQDGADVLDWLDAVVEPALTVTLGPTDDLQERIDQAGVELGTSDVAGAISAAGELAQLVTGRAYGGSKL